MADSAPPPDVRSAPAWWNERYRLQNSPWDTGIVPPELHELVDTGQLRPPGVALDLGCGTGTNAVFLRRLGFVVFGVDLAGQALVRARLKALRAGFPPSFCVGDVADLDYLDVEATFALDIGCLHSLVGDRRTHYAESLARRMIPGGLYLLYGFDLDPAPQSGPYGFEDGEIKTRFAGGFDLLWRRPSTQGTRAVAWYLLKRRS